MARLDDGWNGSFISGGKTFILVTLHVIYGKAPADRVTELKAIAEWLSGWAKDINGWDHNLIALGDFNIDRHGDRLYEAFTSTGLQVAPWNEGLPRTIFDDSKKESSFFDQIAWFNKDSGVPALSMRQSKAETSISSSTCMGAWKSRSCRGGCPITTRYGWSLVLVTEDASMRAI